MRSCCHLFSSVAVLGILGAACGGGGSDGSAGNQGGAGGTGTAIEASAAGGSSTSSSSAQGGSSSNSTSSSTGGSASPTGSDTTDSTGGISTGSGGTASTGGISTGSGGTASAGGISSKAGSTTGGTASSGGSTSTGGFTGMGGTSSRTSSASSGTGGIAGYTPRCHDLGSGGMNGTGNTSSANRPTGGSGGSESSGATAGSGGTTDENGCTPEQLAVRVASKYTILAWADLPDDVKSFMTSFLPLSYIEEHFRFYSYSPLASGTTHGEIHLQIEYGCETVLGFLEWSGTCGEGKLDILYWNGPSKALEIKVDRAEAIRRMTEAGCDTSNLALSLLSTIASNIPGALDCQGRERYSAESVIWLAGRQQTPCKSTMPSSRCNCYKAQCQVDVDSGALKTSPESFSCPACH